MAHHKIALHYELADDGAESSPAVLTNPLVALLEAVNRRGSLSAAAQDLGLSYRHLWNEVNRWEKVLGQQLLVRARGRKGQLSPFAQRLLWAEKEVQARYVNEIAALRAGLEQAFARALDADSRVLRISGCPDEAVSRLRDEATPRHIYLELAFNSSRQGLEDLRDGTADIAGFNFPLGSGAGSDAARAFAPLLDPEEHALIAFATRIQGLAVARGNPMGLHSLLDVSLKRARFVGRAAGTGTHILFTELMKTSGLTAQDIVGADHEAASHVMVATEIASGKADAGLCIASVAAQSGLDFVPMVREIYYLACRKTLLEQNEGRALLEFLAGDTWKASSAGLVGYDLARCGEVLDAAGELGWFG